jgi:ATP-dependent Lon protease
MPDSDDNPTDAPEKADKAEKPAPRKKVIRRNVRRKSRDDTAGGGQMPTGPGAGRAPDALVVERQEDATIIRAGGNNQTVRVPRDLPILPLRGLVVFPGTVMPLNVGRDKSKAMLEDVMPGDKLLGVVAQLDPEEEDPDADEMHQIGCVCTIIKLFRLPDGNQSILVHGLARFRLDELSTTEPYPIGKVTVLEPDRGDPEKIDVLAAAIRQQAERVIEISPNTSEDANQVLAGIEQPGPLADFLAANVQGDLDEKQAILNEVGVEKRLHLVGERLAQQLDVLELQNKIQTDVKSSIDKTQRQFYLREQLKAIRKELGEGSAEGESDAERLRVKLEEADVPELVMKEAGRELDRLDTIPQASPEYGVIRTYLELLGDLPWNVSSEDQIELPAAEQQLDADHHGLEKVKRRILEYLAVRKLKPDGGGAILCFLGPPGVGKTSLGKSIAEATNRKFIRVALGGVRDESEIRGHRRTYIGSMPGRIISELRKAGTNNPVMMLDEIDKVGSDFRGDPASALLEVLDPAQNSTFTDHYLDVPFDLSKVLFIATANTMDTVPGPLRDRMEVIEIPGYTQQDKLRIAQQYLVPRQLEANGLKKRQAKFNEAAIKLIISRYTREAGVRNLERNIGGVVRSIAAKIVGGELKTLTVKPEYVEEVLGPPKFDSELAARTSVAGVATGMAYTPFGGEILFIEASRMAGKGGITLTGQIGDVMKESAQAAFTLIRSRAEELGVDAEELAKSDIHIHVPAGAVPKDGPSAGVAMVTALASLLTNTPARHDVAMTGEITLRGLVLPIGGVKEKTLAAKRAGIKEVILPKRNEKDLPEVPEEVRKALKWHFVETVDEALAITLKKPASKKPSRKKAARK